MSQIKDWFLRLIEHGEYEYLESVGAPGWAITEAKRHALARKKEEEEE